MKTCTILFLMLLFVVGLGEYFSCEETVDKKTFAAVWVLCLVLSIDKLLSA